MASIRLTGAACAGLLALVSTTSAHAQDSTGSGSAQATATTVWQLRSGLNVAALACRGADEHAIVAGYNRMLADHRAELAAVYQQVQRGYGGAANFDAAMTRTYNTYAQPAAQAALCANALGVLDAVANRGDRPLSDFADVALARLEDRAAPVVMTQVAVAAIPQIIDQRPPVTGSQRWSEREDYEQHRGWREDRGRAGYDREDDRRDPQAGRDDRPYEDEEGGDGGE